MNNLLNISKKIKVKLLEVHLKNNIGLIGGNLSSIDILIVLFYKILKDDDVFVLSKGHSALALYSILNSLNLITDEDLFSFSLDGTYFPGHPSGKKIPGLVFPTGSLGHGPSLAAGYALGLKFSDKNDSIFCFCSDGEWQEGSCWEALIFAVHHKLNNLTIMIDQNNLQGFGRTTEVVSYDSLFAKIKSFDIDVFEIDGHNYEEIYEALNSKTNKPKCIIFKTIKGKGLPFEGKLESHYDKINSDDLEIFKNNL